MTPAAPSLDDVEAIARRLPKADLHCHLVGTISLDTVRDLARRAGVAWDPAPVYADIRSLPPADIDFGETTVPMGDVPAGSTPGHSLLAVTERVEDLLRSREDFARVGREAVLAAYASSGTRHLELQVEVGAYLRRGLPYADVVDGLAEGLADARAETGTSALLIAAIDRSRSAAEAVQVVETVVDQPRDLVVGIGLDNLETAGPPERFAEAYALAGRHGLRRTAHSGEHDPTARHVATCLDLLGCERIDHGYFALEDPALVSRVAAEGVPFTCIGTTSRRSWQDWRRASTARLIEAGVAVVIASDDPAMFPTTLADEFVAMAAAADLDAETLIAIARRSLASCWAEESRRRELVAELDLMVPDLIPPPTPPLTPPLTLQNGAR